MKTPCVWSRVGGGRSVKVNIKGDCSASVVHDFVKTKLPYTLRARTLVVGKQAASTMKFWSFVAASLLGAAVAAPLKAPPTEGQKQVLDALAKGGLLPDDYDWDPHWSVDKRFITTATEDQRQVLDALAKGGLLPDDYDWDPHWDADKRSTGTPTEGQRQVLDALAKGGLLPDDYDWDPHWDADKRSTEA